VAVPGRAHADVADLDPRQQSGDDDPSIVDPIELATNAA
jgi:hypothetical protein